MFVRPPFIFLSSSVTASRATTSLASPLKRQHNSYANAREDWWDRHQDGQGEGHHFWNRQYSESEGDRI